MAKKSGSMINVGLVGLGFMAATHIRSYKQIAGVRIAALCNPSGRNLDGDFSKVAGNVGPRGPLKLNMKKVRATKCFEDLLEDPEIHLIDICTPTSTHRELAIAALDAGKHVLCEKPLARSSATAREIADAAHRAKGIFMPAMCMRFWPEWAWLKRAIQEQSIRMGRRRPVKTGKVLAARFRRVAEPPGWGRSNFFNGAESGGGLFDLHIHDTDFIQYCFGRPQSVYSTGHTKVSGAIDHVVTQYHFDSGPQVHAEGSWAMAAGFGFNMAYTVNFENVTVDYDFARGKEALSVAWDGKREVIRSDEPNGYIQELSHLIDCIRRKKAATVVTIEDAATSVEICEAEEISVQTGSIVPLKAPLVVQW
jgi:predicted dehydrogenase